MLYAMNIPTLYYSFIQLNLNTLQGPVYVGIHYSIYLACNSKTHFTFKKKTFRVLQKKMYITNNEVKITLSNLDSNGKWKIEEIDFITTYIGFTFKLYNCEYDYLIGLVVIQITELYTGSHILLYCNQGPNFHVLFSKLIKKTI